MKVQKYIDMAYGNPRGLEWINLIHSPEMWSKWCRRVIENTPPGWYPDSDRPEKILTAAIWHFGYAQETCRSKYLRRTAFRLRQREAPPEGGLGAPKGYSVIPNAELSIYGMPREFWLLDNFLEHEIRPLMDTLTKTTE